MLYKLDRQDDLCDYFILAMVGFVFFLTVVVALFTLCELPDALYFGYF
jgi:hypothetical protein